MEKKAVIIALDFPSGELALRFLGKFPKNLKLWVKIGMQLYYAEGPDFIRKIKEMGHSIFLDLKVCDIPNTVKNVMTVLSQLNVDMVNLHAFGGKAMMEAALQGLTRPNGTRPIVLAVTQLTSITEECMHNEQLISGSMQNCVCHYAKMAQQVGLDGVVCSALEAEIVEKYCGQGFCIVTPGIRLPGDNVDDQARVTTPATAKKIGCIRFIVMGRSITGSKDPVAAYNRACKEFCN